MVVDLGCSIRGLRRDSSNKTAVVPNFALYLCFVGVADSIRLKSIIWLKIVQCAPEAAKILSQYGAEKHQRDSISVLVELLCTLDSRLFSAGASRILVHALHAKRLGRTNFPTRWTFFRDCVTFVNFCTLNWSQDFLLFRGLYEDFGGSSRFKVATEFSHSALCSFHFGFWLDCSPIWRCIQAHFLPNSQEDGVVQLPFRPTLRLRLFSNWLRARSFLSSLSSNLFLLAFRWNLRLLDSLIL